MFELELLCLAQVCYTNRGDFPVSYGQYYKGFLQFSLKMFEKFPLMASYIWGTKRRVFLPDALTLICELTLLSLLTQSSEHVLSRASFSFYRHGNHCVIYTVLCSEDVKTTCTFAIYLWDINTDDKKNAICYLAFDTFGHTHYLFFKHFYVTFQISSFFALKNR